MKTIPLTQGYEAIVDDEDYEWLSKLRWRANKGKNGQPYALRWVRVKGGRRFSYMHREIMQPSLALVVDHINRNSLDNRRSNLRICTQVENILNSTMADGRGASLCPNTGLWLARTRYYRKRIFLGRFPTRDEAQSVVDAARIALAGGADPLAVAQSFRPSRGTEKGTTPEVCR